MLLVVFVRGERKAYWKGVSPFIKVIAHTYLHGDEHEVDVRGGIFICRQCDRVQEMTEPIRSTLR